MFGETNQLQNHLPRNVPRFNAACHSYLKSYFIIYELTTWFSIIVLMLFTTSPLSVVIVSEFLKLTVMVCGISSELKITLKSEHTKF